MHLPCVELPLLSLCWRVHLRKVGWPEPYIYGVYTVIMVGKSPDIRSFTVYIFGSGQP